MVGPLSNQPYPDLTDLLHHDKCITVGPVSHDTIHLWFQCLDVGLIPYAKTEFNRFCSPMRLFDHLASGAWIVATDACDQVKGYERRVLVCDSSESYIAGIQFALTRSRPIGRIKGITWDDRADQMLKVLGGLGIA